MRDAFHVEAVAGNQPFEVACMPSRQTVARIAVGGYRLVTAVERTESLCDSGSEYKTRVRVLSERSEYDGMSE